MEERTPASAKDGLKRECNAERTLGLGLRTSDLRPQAADFGPQASDSRPPTLELY